MKDDVDRDNKELRQVKLESCDTTFQLRGSVTVIYSAAYEFLGNQIHNGTNEIKFQKAATKASCENPLGCIILTRDTRHEDSFIGEDMTHLFQSLKDGFVLSRHNRIIFANDASLRLLGRGNSELTGCSFESVMNDLANPHSNGQHSSPQEAPSVAVRMLSNSRILEITASEIFLQNESAQLIQLRDVTERESSRAENELAKSKSLFNAIINSSPTPYFNLTKRGTIQEVNQAAVDLLGFSRENLLKRNFRTLIAPSVESVETGTQALNAVFSGQVLKGVEVMLQKFDGSAIWASLASGPIEESGTQEQIGIIVQSIDRRKKAEARERLERERANLYLEVMTHDLNNVNQSIMFTLGLMLEQDYLPESMRLAVRDTIWNTRRASRMIANMRDLISLRENPPEIVPFDAASSLERSISRVSDDFLWKKIHVSVDSEINNHIVAAHSYLDEVFFNIIHNSVTYGNSDEIEIGVNSSLVDSGAKIKFEIWDKGPGIPPHLKEDIFRRTGNPDGQIVGRGLGLTLADRIVSNLHGKLWVEDRIEGSHSAGSKFIIELPLWVEIKDLPCGHSECITFYRSAHCLFCDPVFEILEILMDELQVPRYLLQTIDIDSPLAGVSGDELPALPYVRICDKNISGMTSEDAIRNLLVQMLLRECCPSQISSL